MNDSISFSENWMIKITRDKKKKEAEMWNPVHIIHIIKIYFMIRQSANIYCILCELLFALSLTIFCFNHFKLSWKPKSYRFFFICTWSILSPTNRSPFFFSLCQFLSVLYIRQPVDRFLSIFMRNTHFDQVQSHSFDEW